MFTSRTLPALCILILLLLVHPCFAIIRYVNITNSSPGAGTSWTTAYNDLNAALAAASSTDEIWVAQGTYKPPVYYLI